VELSDVRLNREIAEVSPEWTIYCLSIPKKVSSFGKDTKHADTREVLGCNIKTEYSSMPTSFLKRLVHTST